MIFHPLQRLIEAKINDILIVSGPEHVGDVIQLLGSGRGWNCRLTYKVQDEAGGIAQALSLGQEFVGDGRCAVILGDNIFMGPLNYYVSRFLEQKSGARVLLKEVQNPTRFGVATVRENKVVSIEEKPKEPKSPLAVTGFYLYDQQVFGIIDDLKPSDRGELEISDVNSAYLQRGELAFDLFSGGWTDAGTFESLAQANRMVTCDI